jgi:two-component system, chemotaxis family, response regulator Rcp1
MSQTEHFRRHPLEILLVEDEAGDVYLTSEALKKGPAPNRLHVVEDGVEALAFLRRAAQYTDAPRPDLILLDLNLPRKDGREVLAEIKADPALASIPIIVLTTSNAPDDIQRAYELHANCYITKPVELDEFMAVLRTLQEFWFSVARIPRKDNTP